MYEKLKEHTFFAYSRDLEYIAAAAGMMANNLDGHLCREIYDESFINDILRKNREIVEINNTLALGGLEILEGLMSFRHEFCLEEYHQFLLDMPLSDYVYHFFGYYASKEEIEASLADEAKLLHLYEEGKFLISSYVNLKMIIFQRESYLAKFFHFVESIKSSALDTYLEQCEKNIDQLKSQMSQLVLDREPIEMVEMLVKKTFEPRKHYENYTFIPVFMLPRNVVVYYKEEQIILYSQNRISEQEEALLMLRTLADDTRIRIMDLLSERVYENGKNIATKMRLAPSTVSHHMEQLVECKIVKIEKRGNSKYYTIDHENAEKLIHQLKGILLKNS